MAGLLLLIAVVVFWVVWANYATNIPKWDDHVLRAFLFNLDQQTSFFGKTNQFIRQHNEHRIVYDRLITWLNYHLTGKLNFVHLMFVGNLSLLGLLAIFGLVLSQSERVPKTFSRRLVTDWRTGLVYLPPVAFLLLNLSHWENMFWGMAALQNFTVMLWVFGAIYVLAYTQKIGLSLVLAVAATLTSGNGLLIWPVGLGLLLLQTILENRSSRGKLLIWISAAVAAFVLYFWGYQKPPGNPPLKSSFIQLLKGWLAFNGSAAEAIPLESVVTICVLLGGICLVLVLLCCLNILRKYLSREALSPLDYFFLGAAAFLIGTSAVVAWTRTGFGINTLITSRYKLYSLLLIALLYTYIVSQIGIKLKKWVLWSGLLFSVALMIGSYFVYLNEAIWWRQRMQTDQFNWTHGSNRPVLTIDSISRKYTSLSPAFYDTALPTIYGPAQQPIVPVQVTKTPDGYDVMNTGLPAQGIGDGGNFLVARSAERTYLFPVRQTKGPIRRAIFQPENLLTTGFRASILPAELDAGIYLLFVLTVSEDRSTLYETGKTIESSGKTGTTTVTNW